MFLRRKTDSFWKFRIQHCVCGMGASSAVSGVGEGRFDLILVHYIFDFKMIKDNEHIIHVMEGDAVVYRNKCSMQSKVDSKSKS